MYSFLQLHNQMFQNFYPLFCGIQTCEPAYSFGPALRDYHLLHFCLEGKGTYFFDNTNYYIEAGQGFLIFPNELTYYEADAADPWTYLWIAFEGDVIDNYLELCHLSKEHPICSCKEPETLRAIVTDMLEHNTASFRDTLYNQGLLFQFFSCLAQSEGLPQKQDETTDNCYIRKAIEYMKINYQDTITVQEIADYIGLNRSYLSTIFQKNLHVSPQQFLLKYRMTKASELLISSDFPIQTVALSCGYANGLSFTKAFKKYTGYTPSDFRKEKKLKPGGIRTEDPHGRRPQR